MNPFDRLESGVRSYCRSFPALFARARGHLLYDGAGRSWIDFLAGAGALNYGHNHPFLKDRLLSYIARDGVTHSLDLHTEAKAEFLERFEETVLRPRRLEYRVMFPGPTGTNAVEAALKLARKVTGRTRVIAFTNAFHGMTLGSLALTGNGMKRGGAGVDLPGVDRMPYAGFLGDGVDSVAALHTLLEDAGSGVDRPAAVVLETIQAEGGVNCASRGWLRRIARLARSHGALLILDDIQVGCGRTGPFFSFEEAGLRPDLVCLSKSLSGYGLPLSVVLIRPDLDVWTPGEHNGTFRGHNPAFVTAAAALERWWRDDALSREVEAKGERMRAALGRLAAVHGLAVRGRGMIRGLVMPRAAVAAEAGRRAFAAGLVVETAGPAGEVLKLLPPLTIPADELDRGLGILAGAVEGALRGEGDALVGADAGEAGS